MSVYKEKQASAINPTVIKNEFIPETEYGLDFISAAKDFWRKNYKDKIDHYATGNVAGRYRKKDVDIDSLFDSLFICIKTAVGAELVRNKSNSTEVKNQLNIINAAFNLLKKDLVEKEVDATNIIASIQGFVDGYIESVFTPDKDE